MPFKRVLNASREPIGGWAVHTQPSELNGIVRASMGVFDNLVFKGVDSGEET